MKIECIIVYVWIIKKFNKHFINIPLDIKKVSKLMNGKANMYVFILPTVYFNNQEATLCCHLDHINSQETHTMILKMQKQF